MAARWHAARLAWPYSLAATLFGGALLLYLLTRLVGLTVFPIYFFCDEAIQVNLAADFVRDNFQNAAGEFFPTYFYNVDKYSLGTTVYLHILPYLLFGKSVLVTRVVSVLLSCLAAISVGLILRDGFKLPYWWSGALLLSIAPAWFLHSRTAFETVAMVSFYSAGLASYIVYRFRQPRFLYLSLLFFALAFYAYNPAQIVVGVTGALLFVSDIRYHWQQRKIALRGLLLLILLGLPYLRFRVDHPEALQEHLANLNSYWMQSLSLKEKLTRFGQEYVLGLGPGYWFIPNDRDLSRHLMKGYAHLQRASLPFFAIGLVVAIKGVRSSANRAVLIALLAAPAGAAMAQLAVTRALVMVIPATMLIAIGMSAALGWLARLHLPQRVLSIGLFVLLASANLWMAGDALIHGPTWYRDYDLGGMQYGAARLFPEVKKYLQENPQSKLIVSPSWANSVDVLARFFLGDPLPVQLGTIEQTMAQMVQLDEQTVFVMSAREYQLAQESRKFATIQVLHSLPYPDGRTGFYFAKVAYVQDIAAILEEERQARKVLQAAEIPMDGQLVKVRHSLLDLGQIQDIWDNNPRTVARTLEANPFQIEIDFPAARSLQGVRLNIGDTDVRLLVRFTPASGGPPQEILVDRQGTVENPWVSIDFAEPAQVTSIVIHVTDLRQSEPGHVHIWEIDWQPATP